MEVVREGRGRDSNSAHISTHVGNTKKYVTFKY